MISTIRWAIGTVFILAPWLVTPVQAEDCPPLTRIVSIDMVPAEQKLAEMVPVTIQGVPKLMLLDTGGFWNEISLAAADELKLPRRHGSFQIFDVSGHSSSMFATASFELGPLKADSFDLIIAPDSSMFDGDGRVVGLIAPEMLKHYDVDLDFGANTLGLMSPEHCPGKVVYWHPSAVAIVPMTVLDSGHIVVPVVLDGHPVMAMLDTGASNTTLIQKVAEGTYGLTLGAADTPRSGELPSRPGAFTYRHTFATLGFEGVTVKNPQVEIIPGLLQGVTSGQAAPPTGSHLPGRNAQMEADWSMLIGMDILRNFHLYIAYKEEKLYVTPAGETPSATPPVVTGH